MVCCKFIDFAEDIRNRAKSQKKVAKVDEMISKVEEILKFIDYINSLDELEYVVWDNRPLDEVNILNEFKDFILPSAVRYDALNRRTKDLIARNDVKATNPFKTYSDYVNACDMFRAMFKKDGFSDVTSIGSIRRPVNFNDVIARASIEGRVAAQGRPFIPVPLVDVKLFEDRYFNEDANQIIKDYISDMRFI